MAIKAVIFDAYGTLYDVHSLYAKTEELCPGKGDLITQIWRLKQLEYTWLQTSLQDYRDFTFSDPRITGVCSATRSVESRHTTAYNQASVR